ncbi:hypothetical protein TNCT_541731 [Trichonephila clavata]|uniref:Uncharacterized protein n=1 Tax=Trichonephila clavata TaxID=2740835 RepID=A0A8X6HZ84_TRICU|nr:hypothetical protein TNCT_541731 [Trichonephila clavata]
MSEELWESATNEEMNEQERMDEGVPVTQTITVEQACHNLSFLWAQARHKDNRVTYLKSEMEVQAKFPSTNQLILKS